MKLLEAIKNKKAGILRKMGHYFPIYDFYFEQIQDQPFNLLEIGIGRGGSLYAWRNYFPQARITGIDINQGCKKYEGDGIRIFIGDQADTAFLERVNGETGPFDIIIDDGGHMMSQQTTSFKTLFPLLKNNGFYIIEDWHTSFMPRFLDGGGKTIDMLKGLIDGLNYWDTGKEPDYFAKNISSLHFYNGIVFIKKGENQESKNVRF